jgi:hypothetical protein
MSEIIHNKIILNLRLLESITSYNLYVMVSSVQCRQFHVVDKMLPLKTFPPWCHSCEYVVSLEKRTLQI